MENGSLQTNCLIAWRESKTSLWISIVRTFLYVTNITKAKAEVIVFELNINPNVLFSFIDNTLILDSGTLNLSLENLVSHEKESGQSDLSGSRKRPKCVKISAF